MGERKPQSETVRAARLLGPGTMWSHGLLRRAVESRQRVIKSAALMISVAAVALFFCIWYSATTYGYVSPVFLPSPQTVWRAAAGLTASGDLFNDVLVSSRRVLFGFGLAALIAVPLGVIMGVWWPAKSAMDPFISLLRPLPSITWIPLTILWLGIGRARRSRSSSWGRGYTFSSTPWPPS